jgi:hypothetical protein
MSDNDKRLIGSTKRFAVTRESIRRWMDCRYCRKPTPQFILTERAMKKSGLKGHLKMRCCWECGSGLDIVEETINRAEEKSA